MCLGPDRRGHCHDEYENVDQAGERQLLRAVRSLPRGGGYCQPLLGPLPGQADNGS